MQVERDSRRIVARLRREGWVLTHTKGSHQKFKKEGRVVMVCHSRKDLPEGTAKDIAKAAGWV